MEQVLLLLLGAAAGADAVGEATGETGLLVGDAAVTGALVGDTVTGVGVVLTCDALTQPQFVKMNTGIKSHCDAGMSPLAAAV